MKRGFFGLGLLICLLCCGIAVTVSMDRIHTPIAHQLHQASAAAESGNWQEAADIMATAFARWNHSRNLTAAVADHGPMEEIESTFAKAQVLLSQQNTHTFCAVCAELSRQVQAMGEAQGITWQNLL